MTSRYSARIRVDAGDRAPAVLAAVGADAKFHPESGQEAVRVSAGAGGGEGPGGARAAVAVDIGADQLPHLRAGVNSTLRLVQAAYESIGAAAEAGAEADEPAAGGRRSRARAATAARSGAGRAAGRGAARR